MHARALSPQIRAFRPILAHLALAALVASAPAASAEPLAAGAARGKLVLDGKTIDLTHAYAFPVENLFDDKKKDTMVLLTDRALPAERAAEDDVGVSLLARKGELAAVRLRVVDGKAGGAAIFGEGISGMLLFPAKGLGFTSSGKTAGEIAGRFKTDAPLSMEGHTWSTDSEFRSAVTEPAPPKTEESAATPPPAPAPEAPALPKRDPQQSAVEAKAIIARLMEHDSAGAVKLVKGGMDPNGKDENGLSVLNWAVMMCDVPVVKALVDKGADVNYQRIPGYSMLSEAGACPAAEKVLRAAGAK